MANTSPAHWIPSVAPARTETGLLTGRVLARRYRVIEHIGSGGMGDVYRAQDELLDREIALKTIREDQARDETSLARFQRELLAARSISHPSVVRCYELGVDHDTRFFTMELIRGITLESLIAGGHAFSIPEVIDFGSQVLEGLVEAGERGVVHRDLKPQNLMLDHNRRVRILDFGIAYINAPPTDRLTGTSEILGTPDYVSPEQVRGEEPTHQSDLYSLGVVLYEMLTGTAPFHERRRLATLVSRLEREPAAPSEANAHTPSFLDAIILGCLARRRGQRYQSAGHVLADLKSRRFTLGAQEVWSRLPRLRSIVLGTLLAMGTILFASSATIHEASILLVHPFKNSNGDPNLDWISHTIPQMLTAALSQDSWLQPVFNDVADRPNGSTAPVASRVAPDASVRRERVLYGTFTGIGGRIRFDLRLLEVDTGLTEIVRIDAGSQDPFRAVKAIGNKLSDSLDRTYIKPEPLFVTSSPDAAKAYYQAVTLFRRGAFRDAREYLTQAIGHDPRYSSAYARLAELQYHSKDVDAARRTMELAVTNVDRNTLRSRSRLELDASIALSQGETAKAIGIYDELLSKFPYDPSIRLRQALAHESAGDARAASAVFQRVLSRSRTDAVALLGVGRGLLYNNRHEQVIRAVSEGIENNAFRNDEALRSAHLLLGFANKALDRYPEAIGNFRVSLSIAEKVEDEHGVSVVLGELARLHLSQDDLESARTFSRRMLSSARTLDDQRLLSDALAQVASCVLSDSDFAHAIELYLESVEIEWSLGLDANVPSRLNGIAEALHALGDLTTALVYLEHAKDVLALHPNDGDEANNHLITSLVLRDYGQFEEAESSVGRAIALLERTRNAKQLGRAHGVRASLASETGQLVRAAEAFEKALSILEQAQLPVSLSAIRLARASWLARTAQVAKAEEDLALVSEPILNARSHLRVRYFEIQAEVALIRRELSVAQNFSRRAVDASLGGRPADGIRTRLTYGEVLMRQGSRSRAATVLRAALDLAITQGRRPEATMARVALARVLLDDGSGTEAWTEVEEAMRGIDEFGPAAPALVDALLAGSSVAFALGRLDESRRKLRRAETVCQALGLQISAVRQKNVTWPRCNRVGHSVTPKALE